jgi:hypothetical protein
MFMNTNSICIEESQVIYRIYYNSRTTGPILVISDLLDSSPYKNKNKFNLGKNTNNYLDKIIYIIKNVILDK